MPRTEHKLSDSKYAKKQLAVVQRGLRDWRIKSGRTLANVAEQTGVSANQVYNIESGRGAPSFSVLVILCREAGITVPSALAE
jgi:transcriptional regulator with XRE-family HTH domain